VIDLVKLLAKDGDHSRRPGEAVGNTTQALPHLSIDGFTLLPSEPVGLVLREADELLISYPAMRSSGEALQQMLEDIMAPEASVGAQRQAEPVANFVSSSDVPAAEASVEPPPGPCLADKSALQATVGEPCLPALARLAEWQGARIAELSAQLQAQQAQSAALEREVVQLRQQLACPHTAASTTGGMHGSAANHAATARTSMTSKDVCSGSDSSNGVVANSVSPRPAPLPEALGGVPSGTYTKENWQPAGIGKITGNNYNETLGKIHF
jgi:hypothetical protein